MVSLGPLSLKNAGGSLLQVWRESVAGLSILASSGGSRTLPLGPCVPPETGCGAPACSLRGGVGARSDPPQVRLRFVILLLVCGGSFFLILQVSELVNSLRPSIPAYKPDASSLSSSFSYTTSSTESDSQRHTLLK